MSSGYAPSYRSSKILFESKWNYNFKRIIENTFIRYEKSKNIGKKGYPSIRGELNRICYDIQFNKEQDRINKFIEIEEEMDEIENRKSLPIFAESMKMLSVRVHRNLL